ncbi:MULTISPECIES: LysR substrate-binding domain-containing protein [Providencia]|uniref:LysR substrate-binding domain-containing protein n=1 Tax=Providencia TaxID=586 RepID=UPI00197CB884|nr:MULTISPECIES: LysR substrate-binding domain-containing protein [Providencia]MBN4866132.1 LysR family transcriptional regulator [Providencia stuartii]MBN4875675.1 LysR family transcriptional regulator [Providencia stuartii]MBN4880367.1 LysR family transcriptional regulator [Providencia stuartii]MBN4884875.1 LysR family transcriptional regulator [Providencia stuartii]
MHFDITDLKLCVNVANAGSITHGAKLTYITLQSASERIRGLENELGVNLFTRSAKGVALSDAGYAFIEHAKIILQQIELMQDKMQQYSRGLRGHINILCNTSAQMEFLPSRLHAYLRQQPNMSVSVKDMPSANIVTSIKNKVADVGIIADSVDLAGLDTRSCSSDELVVFVHKDSLWANQKRVSFADIIGAEFIGLTEDNPLQTHIDDNAKQQGQRLHYRVHMPTLDAVMQGVNQGIGIAIIPRQAALRYGPSDTQILQLAENWAQRKLVICARDFSLLPNYTNEFIDFLINWQP